MFFNRKKQSEVTAEEITSALKSALGDPTVDLVSDDDDEDSKKAKERLAGLIGKTLESEPTGVMVAVTGSTPFYNKLAELSMNELNELSDQLEAFDKGDSNGLGLEIVNKLDSIHDFIEPSLALIRLNLYMGLIAKDQLDSNEDLTKKEQKDCLKTIRKAEFAMKGIEFYVDSASTNNARSEETRNMKV